jgi:hypothetical protein
MATSFRSVLERFAAIALLGLAFLALLELSTRVYLFGFAGLDPARIGSVRALPQTDLVRDSPHPQLGWELRPDADGYFKLARFRTNSRGLRDREYSLEKPPDSFRVAVLGASFTLPAGVEIEDAFHSVLEDRLSAGSDSLSYEFINFAVGGYGPRQCLAMLQLRALEYDPDLVLFALTRLSMPRFRQAWNRPLPTRAGPRRQHVAYQSFLLKLVELRLGRSDVSMERPKTSRRELGVPSILEKLGELSRERGVPVVVVLLEYDTTVSSLAEEFVVEEIREQGLHYVDTREAFTGTRPSEFWIYELDPHPNARAHAIFADVLATFLRSNLLIGPGT